MSDERVRPMQWRRWGLYLLIAMELFVGFAAIARAIAEYYWMEAGNRQMVDVIAPFSIDLALALLAALGTILTAVMRMGRPWELDELWLASCMCAGACWLMLGFGFLIRLATIGRWFPTPN